MAKWIECTLYNEDRNRAWFNLDQVVRVVDYGHMSTLLLAASDERGAIEINVCERAKAILSSKARTNA